MEGVESLTRMRSKQIRPGLSKTRSPCRPWILACSQVSASQSFYTTESIVEVNPTNEWLQNLARAKLVLT